MKILFLSKSPDATEYFRVVLPCKFLAREGHTVKYNYLEKYKQVPGSGISQNDIDWADVIIFQRPVNAFSLHCISAIKRDHPEKVLVGEYDDDYNSVPRWNPGYGYVTQNENSWKSIIPFYDGVIVSTEPLKKAIGAFTEVPIQVIENGLDLDEFEKLEKITDTKLIIPKLDKDMNMSSAADVTIADFNKIAEDKVVLCWAGSRFHFFDIDWVTNVLPKVLEDEKVIALFVGYIQGNIVKSVPLNKLYVCSGVSPIHKYYSLLKSLKIDVYMAPLDPCEFNQSKSSLKIQEGLAIGAIPVASDWDPYELRLSPVEGSKTARGYLADYSEEHWVDCLRSAIKDVRSGQGKKWKEHNWKWAREKYDAKTRTKSYVDFFRYLIDRKRTPNE